MAPPQTPPARSRDRRSADATSSRTLLFPYLSRLAEHRLFPLILSVLYGVLVLLAALRYHVVGDYDVETDFLWSYVPEAKRLLTGIVTIDGFRGPGYPILLALVATIVRDYFISGVVLSVIAGASFLGLSAALLRRIVGADRAFFVSVAMAVSAVFVQFTYTAGTDMVFAAVLMLSTYFFLRSEERRLMDVIVSGVLAGAAYMVRYNGLVAVIAFVLAILALNPFRLDGKERLKTAGIFVGAFFVVILPYGLYCLAQKGSFFYTENYLNIAREMYRDRFGHDQFWLSEAQKYHSTAQVILGDPTLFVKMVVRNIYEHASGDLERLVGWQIGVFSLAGLLLVWRERANRRLMTFYILFAGLFGILLLLLQQIRYSLFLFPGYILLASLALNWKGLHKLRFWNRVHLGGIAAVLLLVWTFDACYKFNRENIDSGPKEIPAIADWFHRTYGHAEDGKVVMTRKPHIAYYLDMTMTIFPLAENETALAEEVRKTGASYLFFSRMEAGLRPQFQYLLDPARAPAWLVPLTYTVAPPAVLYRVDLTKAP